MDRRRTTANDEHPRGPAIRLITLSWYHFLVVCIVIFVLFAATFLAVAPVFDEFLWEHLLAGGLEDRFGFRGGRVPVSRETGKTYEVYTILEVTPGGPLDEAGFAAGDAPRGAFHSNSVSFLRKLAGSCERPHTVWVKQVGPDGFEAGVGRDLAVPCVE
jgi:hypothetical protein